MNQLLTTTRLRLTAGILFLGLCASACSSAYGSRKMHRSGDCQANKVGNHRR